MRRTCVIGRGFAEIAVGAEKPLAIIAGPCVLESPALAAEIAQRLRDACARLGLSYVFKASFDKANRSSAGSPRGPGLGEGLAQIAEVRERFRVPVTTDIHEPAQAETVARAVDLLQIPAFLCRQTDLLIAAGRAAAAHGRAVNIKKGQFVSPAEMEGPVAKVERGGCGEIMLTERGTFFGYGRLVNDFLGLGDMMDMLGERSPPVCFDCTHSTQQPGASGAGEGRVSGGRPERAPMLARAAVAAGVDAVFLECHPDPPKAHSDAATALPLKDVPAILESLAHVREAARRWREPLRRDA